MSDKKLQGTLNFFTGTILVLTVILGSGLLILPGIVYRMIGDSAIYTWIVCSIFSIPLLLVMIELGRIHQSAGGIAYYAKIAFGRYLEVLVFVFLLGAIAFGLPSIAMTGGLYLSSIKVLPNAAFSYSIFIVVGSAFLASRKSQSIPKIVKLVGGSVLFLLILILLIFLTTIAFTESPAIQVTNAKDLSLSVILQPFMLVFFSFTGWEIASHLAEDFKNPRRDYPLAIALSFLIVCVLYIGSAYLVQEQRISDFGSTAMNSVGERLFGSVASYPISLLAYSLVFANIFGAVSAIARLVYYMASRQYLPSYLGRLTHGTPVNAIFAVALVLILNICLAEWGVIDIQQMFSIAGQNFLILYLIASLCLFRLSKSTYSRVIALLVGVPSVYILIKYSTAPVYILSLLAVTQITYQMQKGGNRE
nr:amino acid permease [uncultured Rhodoferax sp.]